MRFAIQEEEEEEDPFLTTKIIEEKNNSRPVSRGRVPIPRTLLGRDGSTASNPDSMDILRRVSIQVAQHVEKGENKRRAARKPHRLSTPSILNTNAGKNSKERWYISKEFNEEHFVRPQRRYFLPNIAGGLGLLSCFSMTYVRPSYHNPSDKVIFDFIQRLFKRANLHAGCSVICLIYVERLMNRT